MARNHVTTNTLGGIVKLLRTVKDHSLSFDYFLTTVASLLIVGAGVLVYRLASIFLGQQGFSEYALLRRIIALLLPALLLGIGVALPRLIALMASGASQREQKIHFVSSLAVVSMVVVGFLLIANWQADLIAFLFFGDREFARLIPALSMVVVGLSWQTVCYAFFRGQLHMVQANLLQVLTYAVAPIAAFYIGDESVERVMTWTGILSILFTVVFMLKERLLVIPAPVEFMGSIRTLLNYGLRRVPGDFALMALLTLPATVVAHLEGILEAGMVAFGTALITLGATIVTPISILLLPHATQLISENRADVLRRQVKAIMLLVVPTAIVGTALGELVLPYVVRWYLGAEYVEHILSVRIMLIGVVPYVVYVAMRSINDAAFVRAINARNSYAALSVAGGGAAVGVYTPGSVVTVLVCFVLGLCVLSGLTVYHVSRVVRRDEATAET